jgi:hypothetical protein
VAAEPNPNPNPNLTCNCQKEILPVLFLFIFFFLACDESLNPTHLPTTPHQRTAAIDRTGCYQPRKVQAQRDATHPAQRGSRQSNKVEEGSKCARDTRGRG